MQEKNAECKIKMHFFSHFSPFVCSPHLRTHHAHRGDAFVRHFVYCVRITFGHSQASRPARFVLNADVALFFVFRPMSSGTKSAATSLPPLILFQAHPMSRFIHIE